MPPPEKRRRKANDPDDLPVVGWREWVEFPELGINFTKAKIDTGARTSSLHAFEPERFRRKGRDWIRFVVHPLQRSVKDSIVCEAEVIDERRVRSSSGHTEVRPVIRTKIVVARRIFRIELTLAARDDMGFRMLLGRAALRSRFTIDPGRSFIGGTPPELRRRRKKRVQRQRRTQ